MKDAKIYVYDEFNPEDTAMMQALYSRSQASVTEHVEKVKQSGSGKFMEKFYVGYGHKSIADCGSTTIFIEGVSMFVTKAIQDWPLYSGQESSTRYIDYSEQPIINPVGTDEAKEILEKWRKFYLSSLEPVREHIKRQYPRKPEEKESVYDKAVAARSFDIMRGFLPSGMTTQLSWHTNLRQAWDKLSLLRHHPLAEISFVAHSILEQLKEKYPNSFSHDLYDEQEEYWKYLGEKYTFYWPDYDYDGEFKAYTNIKREELEKYNDVLEKRPQKTNLPVFLGELGNVTFEYLLDFGSFRDLQRHRNGVCRMPLITDKYGFNQWYLDQLPDDLKAKAEQLIKEQRDAISKLECKEEDRQYYCHMGRCC